MNKISKQEFVVGFAATITLAFKIGWYATPLSIACSVLWAIGGTYAKFIRREGVSILCGTVACLVLRNSFCLFAIPAAMLVLHQGDGFPDHRPTTLDEGSRIGKFIERFVSNPEIGGPITKMMIAFLLQLAFIPIWIA